MNKHWIIKASILLLAVMFVAGIAVSCGSSGSSDKTLTSITIGGETPDKIPDPISSDLLNSGAFYDASYTGTVYLNGEAAFSNTPIVVQISGGAKAAYGLASGFDAPTTWSSANTLPVIQLGQALYVRVTAEDGSVNYYRFTILLISDNSQLSILTVAGMGATLAAPGTAWNNAGNGTISLSNAQKENAVVVATPANMAATVEFALVTTSGAPGAYSTTSTFTFADGNILYVKVTAENGEKISIYKFTVQIGRDATLLSVVIGETEAESLGTPKATWGTFTNVQRGSCQVDERMPDTGFTVVITPTDEEAAVVWQPVATSVTAEPAAYTGTSPHIFPPDQSDIIIKVTSANGANTRYYRIRLITKSWGTIYKGTPKLENPSDANDKQYIDPIWNAEEWLDVSRINTAESYANWFATDTGRHTTAKAKALWDDDGLWVYWDIDFTDYNDGTAAQTRTAVLSGAVSSYTPGTDVTIAANSTPADSHVRDSVELFINERFQTYKTGNYGNQYRSGLPNADGTIWLSGEKGNPPTTPTYFNPITQFQIDKKVNAWVKKNGANKEIGYVIIMRAQWVKGYTADIDAVFNTDGTVKDGAEIGVELQVNASSDRGGTITRDGILTWNGVTSQAYQNVKSFGIVTLKTTRP
jgi:hypothetical protein